MKYLPGLFVLILLFFSCTFTNEEDYFGDCDIVDDKGDTVIIVYSDLSPVFEGICASCHYPDNPYRKSIVLNNYLNVVKSFDEKVTDTETPKIIQAIKHEGPYKMPFNQAKLTDCEIEMIVIWYKKGMPNSKL